MKVIRGLDSPDLPLTRSVLTVGNFDGVHRAHLELLRRAKSLASTRAAPVVVLTFEPHPLTVVAPQKAPPRLASLDDKLRYLQEGGADTVVVARSEPSLLTLEAEAFVEQVLVRSFHPTDMVEGPSFGFGRGRKGTPELLAELAARHGYRMHIVPQVSLDLEDGPAITVSSSLIRRLLTEGDVEKAALCLTRSYALSGPVVRGMGMGRPLGFPTVNLECPDQLIPGRGVYSGWAQFLDRTLPCAINLGSAPTFGVEQMRVEAHVLDFTGDLYGTEIRLWFVGRIREQHKFVSPTALVEQLQRDIGLVRDSLSRLQPPERLSPVSST